tara:strand:+ start:271 stop:993 length:723 start_codon:yes stop_codon:yes gene_type:complete
MKTAVCIAGYFDSFTDPDSKGVDGYKHLQKHVFSKCDADVYMHSWDFEKKQLVLDLYGESVKGHCFEPQIDFSSIQTVQQVGGYAPQSRLFSQYYSVQKSFELLEQTGEKYDCVIKTRFDVGRINRRTSGAPNAPSPYAVQCINFDVNLDMQKFYLAEWSQQTFDEEGPADMWFYSSQQNMMAFTNFFNLIKKEMIVGSEMEKWAGSKHGGLVNGIKCYKWFLIRSGLWNKRVTLSTTWE